MEEENLENSVGEPVEEGGDVAESIDDNTNNNNIEKEKETQRRNVQTIGEAFGWSTEEDLLANFKPLSSEIMDRAKSIVASEAAQRKVTLNEVLQVPATVENRRKLQRILELEERQCTIIKDAVAVVVDLVGAAQVENAQRVVRELQKQHALEKSARKKRVILHIKNF